MEWFIFNPNSPIVWLIIIKSEFPKNENWHFESNDQYLLIPVQLMLSLHNSPTIAVGCHTHTPSVLPPWSLLDNTKPSPCISSSLPPSTWSSKITHQVLLPPQPNHHPPPHHQWQEDNSDPPLLDSRLPLITLSPPATTLRSPASSSSGVHPLTPTSSASAALAPLPPNRSSSNYHGYGSGNGKIASPSHLKRERKKDILLDWAMVLQSPQPGSLVDNNPNTCILQLEMCSERWTYSMTLTAKRSQRQSSSLKLSIIYLFFISFHSPTKHRNESNIPSLIHSIVVLIPSPLSFHSVHTYQTKPCFKNHFSE